MQETRNLKPEKAMYLLPYAVRYDLPHQQIFDVISRCISTNELENLLSELDEPVYSQALLTKCHVLESVVKSANDTIFTLTTGSISSLKEHL